MRGKLTNPQLNNQVDLLVLGHLIYEKTLTNIAIPLASDNLPGLVSNLT